jgi:hypothetical protein
LWPPYLKKTCLHFALARICACSNQIWTI